MTLSKYPFHFDPEAVIDRFGGINETYMALASVGCDIYPKAVRKWLERGVVPADAIIALHVYSLKNDGPGVFDLCNERKQA